MEIRTINFKDFHELVLHNYRDLGQKPNQCKFTGNKTKMFLDNKRRVDFKPKKFCLAKALLLLYWFLYRTVKLWGC